MGTNEKLVPRELLKPKIKCPFKYRVQENLKNKSQAINFCLNNNINEEITHV